MSQENHPLENHLCTDASPESEEPKLYTAKCFFAESQRLQGTLIFRVV